MNKCDNEQDNIFDDIDEELEEVEGIDEINQANELVIKVLEPASRLDSFLTEQVTDMSRSAVQKLIKDANVLVNGEAAKVSQSVEIGDSITVNIPVAKEISLIAQDIPLDVIYEDKDVIVINKPCGMVVHPAAGNHDKTMVNALMWHCGDLSGINGELRPGIVHRIDKETSGLIIAAKNDAAHRGLVEEWHTKEVKRYYIALLHGSMGEPGGTIDAPIGRHAMDRKKMAVTPGKGRNAITHYKVLERFSKYTLIEAKLDTGRTHQIRVHMAYINHPVVGDIIYGPQKKKHKRLDKLETTGQFLHSAKMTFRQPITNEIITCEAPLPAKFAAFLEAVKKEGR